jgi:drug/metabolite transporter (DMT)-like permease
MSRVLVLAVVGVLSVSSASIIVRLVNAPTLAVVFWRLTFSVLFLLLIGFRRVGFKCVRGVGMYYVLVSGLALGIHFISWIESLRYVSIAVSVTLVSTYPVLTAVESYFIFGERLRFNQYLGVFLCVLGVLMMSLVSGFDVYSSYGVLLALVGSLSASIYFLIGRYVRRFCGLIEYVLPAYSTSALTTLLIAISLGVDLVDYPLSTWFFFILLALGPMIGGHTVFNYLLRFMSAVTVSTLVALEPVGATLLGVLVLGELPGPVVLLGMLVTVLGVCLVLR